MEKETNTKVLKRKQHNQIINLEREKKNTKKRERKKTEENASKFAKRLKGEIKIQLIKKKISPG